MQTPNPLFVARFVLFLQKHCVEVASLLGLKYTTTHELAAEAPPNEPTLMVDHVFTRGPEQYITIYAFVNHDGYCWFAPDYGGLLGPCFDYELPSPWRAAVIEELIQRMCEDKDVGDFVNEASMSALYESLRAHRGHPKTLLEAESGPFMRLDRRAGTNLF